jgi:hypothetical protein
VNDQVLTILKGCLVAVLYLFLARVVWVVNRELRGTPSLAPAQPPTAPKPSAARTAPAKEPKRRGWQLEVREPETHAGRAFPVDGELTIGRGGGCALSFPDDTFVSTLHARVFPRGDAIWIEDLGSTNGTTVNGVAVNEPTRLRKGDRIAVGGVALEVGR